MRRWLKWLGLILLLLTLAVPALGYVALTSNRFWQSQVIARVDDSPSMDLSVGSVAADPFQGLVAQEVRFERPGLRVEAQQLRVEYAVDELLERRVRITRLQLVDGTVWVDTTVAQPSSAEDERAAKDDDSAPWHVRIEQILLKGFDGQVFVAIEGERRQILGFEHVTATANQVAAGEAFEVNLHGAVDAEFSDGKLAAEKLEARATGRFDESFAVPAAEIALAAEGATGKFGQYVLDGHELKLSGALERRDTGYVLTALQFAERDRGAKESLFALAGALALAPQPSGSFQLSARPLQLALLKTLPNFTVAPSSGEMRAEIEITLQPQEARYRLVGPVSFDHVQFAEVDVAPLSGKLDIRASTEGSAVQIEKAAVQLSEAENVLLEGSANGSLGLPHAKEQTGLTVTTAVADVPRLQAIVAALQDMMNEGTVGKDASAEDGQPSSSPADEPVLSAGHSARELPFAAGVVHLDLRRVILEPVVLRRVSGSIDFQRSKLATSGIEVQTPDARAVIRGSLDELSSDAPHYTAQGEISGYSLARLGEQFHLEAAPRGTVTQLAFETEGRGFSADAFRDTFQGSFRIQIENPVIPHGLQDQVPFNLILLPIEVVGKVGLLTQQSVLPPVLNQATKFVFGSLSEGSTALSFAEASGELKIDRGTYRIDNVHFRSVSLPDVLFDGVIESDNDIELMAALEYAGVKLPLPITGTLSTPIPDVVRFSTALSREVGLSVLNVPEHVLKKVADYSPGAVLDVAKSFLPNVSIPGLGDGDQRPATPLVIAPPTAPQVFSVSRREAQ
ncbi:MAG: hypothetical protein KDD69_16460 [Bdellovibrionales bacterium]|nr:hypothetical protein [Bdellovibrionales bacterium]